LTRHTVSIDELLDAGPGHVFVVTVMSGTARGEVCHRHASPLLDDHPRPEDRARARVDDDGRIAGRGPGGWTM